MEIRKTVEADVPQLMIFERHANLKYNQMTLKEYIDPFTGEPVVKNR